MHAETMEYIFRVSQMICQRFCVPMIIKKVLDKIRLVFHAFLCFLAAFLKFCQVVQ